MLSKLPWFEISINNKKNSKVDTMGLLNKYTFICVAVYFQETLEGVSNTYSPPNEVWVFRYLGIF